MSVNLRGDHSFHPDSRCQPSTIKNDVVESASPAPHTQTGRIQESSLKRVHFSADTGLTDTSDHSTQLPIRVKQYLDSLRDILSATDDLLSTKKVRKHFWSYRKYPEEASKSWCALGRRSDRSLESVFGVCLGLIRERKASSGSHAREAVRNEVQTAVRQKRENSTVRQIRRALEISYPQTRFTALQLSAASSLETRRERTCFVRKRAFDIAHNIQVRMGRSVGDISLYPSDFATISDQRKEVDLMSGDISISDLLYIRQLHRELVYAWRTEVESVSSKSG